MFLIIWLIVILAFIIIMEKWFNKNSYNKFRIETISRFEHEFELFMENNLDSLIMNKIDNSESKFKFHIKNFDFNVHPIFCEIINLAYDKKLKIVGLVNDPEWSSCMITFIIL